MSSEKGSLELSNHSKHYSRGRNKPARQPLTTSQDPTTATTAAVAGTTSQATP